MTPLWIIGAGGHCKVVIDTARASGRYEVVGVLDDDPSRWKTSVLDVPVLGEASIESLRLHKVIHGIIAVGCNRTRAKLAARLDGAIEWATLVHPRAYLASHTSIGPGSILFAGAIVQPDTVVGRHAILNTASSVDHDCHLGDFAHVAPGGRLAGGVHVGTGVLLGIGACILPGCRVGDWATIGAGGVVIRDIPAGVTAIGVPARSIPT